MSYRKSVRQVVVAFNGKVLAMDLVTGERVWSYDLGGSATVRLAIDDGKVYCCAYSGLACLDYDSGRELWRTAEEGNETLLVVGDRVLTGCNGELRCYSAADGRRLWEDKFKGMGLGCVALGVPGNIVQADRQH